MEEIARLRAKTKKFALTSIEEDLAEPAVEKAKPSAIEKLDVDKLETDFLSFAKRAPREIDPELYGEDFEAEDIQTPEQIAKKNRIAALIAKQQNFKLEAIGEEEDNMYASGTNEASEADIVAEAKEAAKESQFSDEEVNDDGLMAKLRRIEAEQLAAR